MKQLNIFTERINISRIIFWKEYCYLMNLDPKSPVPKTGWRRNLFLIDELGDSSIRQLIELPRTINQKLHRPY